MLDNWLPFLIYGSLAVAIPLSMIAMSFAFSTRPVALNRTRTVPFESGVSEGAPHVQRFTISFYLTALLFIVFDIEAIFLYPWAVLLLPSEGYAGLGWPGYLSMGIFVFTLVAGLVYVWKKGVLDWND